MLNQTILVGRLANEPEIYETENGNKVTNIILAVPRSYKNLEGVYETDFIKCTLWKGVAENTVEYCKKGDIIGVKGRLQTFSFDNNESSQKESELKVVAEKITFLQSKSKTHNEKQYNEAR